MPPCRHTGRRKWSFSLLMRAIFATALVRAVGIEPTLSYEKRILSPLRLPFRHARRAGWVSTAGGRSGQGIDGRIQPAGGGCAGHVGWLAAHPERPATPPGGNPLEWPDHSVFVPRETNLPQREYRASGCLPEGIFSRRSQCDGLAHRDPAPPRPWDCGPCEVSGQSQCVGMSRRKGMSSKPIQP